jgi:hypothetical protein
LYARYPRYAAFLFGDSCVRPTIAASASLLADAASKRETMQRSTILTSVRVLCFVAIVQFVTAAAPNVSYADDSLVGAWKVAEIVTTGANASSNANPQPGLSFLTKSHYSLTRITSDKERPKFAAAKNPAALTDVEKIARYEQWLGIQA